MFQKIIRYEVRRNLFHLTFLITLSFAISLEAAQRGQYYQDCNLNVSKEVRDTVEGMRHQVYNHEVEIRIFDEKLKNFDSMIESVRDQFNDSCKWQKEQLKGNSVNLEGKISTLDTVCKSIVGDLRQFQTHSKEVSDVLSEYKLKILELEKTIDQQNQNIEHLQAAMRSLMEAFQGSFQKPEKSPAFIAKTNTFALSNSQRTYKVKSGDSLEKIARANHTTIQAIKEANGLTTDRIVVGKTLVIPE